jgi:hypothetical protein
MIFKWNSQQSKHNISQNTILKNRILTVQINYGTSEEYLLRKKPETLKTHFYLGHQIPNSQWTLIFLIYILTVLLPKQQVSIKCLPLTLRSVLLPKTKQKYKIRSCSLYIQDWALYQALNRCSIIQDEYQLSFIEHLQ